MVSLLRRIAPALLLLVLAPLVAEFLLGDFSVRGLGLLIVFLPQYGGGALLIREVTRRTGRGWPTMLLLAAAYALIEEGFTTQSLFDPNYVPGLRLLDYGFIPALGTSPVWSLFVLSIHVVWSIATPILIAEGLAGPRRTTPWLGRVGLAVTAGLFVLGSLATTAFTLQTHHFVASAPQFAAVVLLVVGAIAAAFLLFRPAGGGLITSRSGQPAPPPLLVALVALALATAFQLARHFGPDLGLPAAVTVLGMLACEAVAVGLVLGWSRRPGWGRPHLLALANGAVLTYAWLGLSAFLAGRTKIGARTDLVDVIGQVVEVMVVLGLVGWAMLRGGGAAMEPAPRGVAP